MKRDHYIIKNLKLGIVLFMIFILLQEINLGHTYISKKISWSITIMSYSVLIAAVYIGYVHVYRKYKKLDKIFTLYLEGYLGEEVFQENMSFSPNLDNVLKMFTVKLDEVNLLNLSKNQAQYLALQNQINPHFLYNTLESIRSEALCSGVGGVASMAEALATFFRYTISNLDKLVTLEDELNNVESYYSIQKYRFGDKLDLMVEYEGDHSSILNMKMPKLILQPIVENAIYHGVEQKIGKGKITIYIMCTTKGLIIRVSDDGLGIEKNHLEILNNKFLINSLDGITEPAKKKREGIALINVNNRIKLLFGEEYGIYIQSTKDVGTDVEITLPRI